MRILQLTDLHVFCEPGMQLKGIPTRECLQDVVSYILQHESLFDHVIVTGDHTHDELPQSYRAVQEILSPWKDKLWQVPGNHDDRGILRSVFAHRVTGTADDRVNFQFTAENWTCVGLDTHMPGEVSGLIEENQIDWLKRTLGDTSSTRIALFFHHPPVDVNSLWMDAIGLNGRQLLQDVIANDQRIRLICCGHVHHEFHAALGHADIYTTPSTGIQFDPEGESARFAPMAPGYRVIEFDGDDFTTQVIRLPEVKYVPAE